MELGGNIKLDGLEGIEPALLIVIKKIVGNFAKRYSEKTEVKELLVTLEDKDKNKVTVKLQGSDKEFKESKEGDNLFFVLDEMLVKIQDKLEK